MFNLKSKALLTFIQFRVTQYFSSSAQAQQRFFLATHAWQYIDSVNPPILYWKERHDECLILPRTLQAHSWRVFPESNARSSGAGSQARRSSLPVLAATIIDPSPFVLKTFQSLSHLAYPAHS